MTSLRLALSALVTSSFWIPISMAQSAQPLTTSNTLERATQAWLNGDFIKAHELAQQNCDTQPSDDSLRILVLASYALGHYATTLSSHQAMSKAAASDHDILETVLWAHLRLKQYDEAIEFAESHGMLRDPSTREQLRLAQSRPLNVKMAGLTILPFSDDGLSPCMPGISVKVDGHSRIARLDTGGSFLHLTRSQAKEMGVRHAGAAREFAGLMSGPVSYGTTNIELGDIRIDNVPTAVHADRTFASAPIAAAFGVEVGPIIGTNILAMFASTIDSCGQRLVLSDPDDPAVDREHRRMFEGPAWQPTTVEIPFGLIEGHMLVARGVYDDRTIPMFVDSGLVALDSEHGQAALLIPRETATRWSLSDTKPNQLTSLLAPLGFNSVARDDLAAMVVSDRTWKQFGQWSGVQVKALISYGFLKHYAWSIDFRRRILSIHVPTR